MPTSRDSRGSVHGAASPNGPHFPVSAVSWVTSQNVTGQACPTCNTSTETEKGRPHSRKQPQMRKKVQRQRWARPYAGLYLGVLTLQLASLSIGPPKVGWTRISAKHLRSSLCCTTVFGPIFEAERDMYRFGSWVSWEKPQVQFLEHLLWTKSCFRFPHLSVIWSLE